MIETLVYPQKLEAMNDFLATAPAGCVVEVGVYQGGSLYWLAERNPSRRFYGYDTFTGMPPAGKLDNYYREGDFPSSFKEVASRIKPNVQLIQGLFPTSDTIQPTEIALANVDVDIFSSTYESMCYLAPRMAKGGRMYCDDAFYESCQGATFALCKFAIEKEMVPHLVMIPHNPLTYFQF